MKAQAAFCGTAFQARKMTAFTSRPWLFWFKLCRRNVWVRTCWGCRRLVLLSIRAHLSLYWWCFQGIFKSLMPCWRLNGTTYLEIRCFLRQLLKFEVLLSLRMILLRSVIHTLTMIKAHLSIDDYITAVVWFCGGRVWPVSLSVG